MDRPKILLTGFAVMLLTIVALSTGRLPSARAQDDAAPANEPVHYRLTCVGNQGCVANFPAIPAGKRLWIQHVSTRVRGNGYLSSADAAVGARQRGSSGCAYSHLYWVPLQPTGGGAYVGSQPMVAFIDPDTGCSSQILAEANGTMEADFTITGYLSPRPQ